MKVSIITVCKNAQETIEKTIKSVISQDYKDIEYIIIDGGSTDGTLEIINKYRNKIKTIVSRPDKGIYYAMNDGIDKAGGEIIYFLNAGDFLFDKDVVAEVVKQFLKDPIDVIYGDVLLYNRHDPKRLILVKHKNINRFYLAHDGIYHQAMFARRNLFDKYGKFNTRFKLAADYEWTLRVLIGNSATSRRINKTIVKYLLGGASFNRKKSLKERYQMLLLYFSPFEVVFVGIFFWLIYRIAVKINRKYFQKVYELLVF